MNRGKSPVECLLKNLSIPFLPMKYFLIISLFISFETFSQKISFKILGVFQTEIINYVDVHKWPNISIDTIMIIDKHKFEIRGKMDYPQSIEVAINEYQSGYGVFSDGKPITVFFDAVQDITSKKKVFVITPQKIEGNPISESNNNITLLFRKIKFSENFNENRNNEVIEQIESHLKKYPTSYSNIGLIGANLDIMTNEKIEQLFNKLPKEAQEADSGPWILKTLNLRIRNSVGKKIPNFLLVDSIGVKHNLVDTTKQLTFIQFWASDCGPCRINNRELVKLLRTIDQSKISIVNVSLDTVKENWLEAIKKDKVLWLQLIDYKSFNSEIVNFFGFNAIPFDLLVDKDLKIISMGFSKSIETIKSYSKK